MLVKVEELTDDLSRVRLFHTSVSRAIASWPTWAASPASRGDFDEYLAQKFPTSTAADFADPRGRRVSEDTYVEQGLYWATGHQPMLKYVVKTYKPDLLLAGVPTTDEFQHQFLGLVTQDAAQRRREPGLRRRQPQRRQGPPRRQRARRTSGPAYEEADETLDARPQAGGPATRRRSSPRTTASRRSSWRSTPARSLVDLGPALEAADVQLPARDRRDRSARRRPAGPAAPSRST